MKKRAGSFFVLFSFLFLFIFPLSINASFIKVTRLLMSTTVTIIAEASVDDIEAAFERIREIELMMNHYNPDSQISLLNRKGKLKVSPEVREVLLRSIYFSKVTQGAFDVTVGPLVRLWQKMGREGRLPTSEEIETALSLVGYEKIKIEKEFIFLEKKGMLIDLGGIAKGYAVDEAIEVLKKRGVKNALVEAGGDLYCMGEGSQGKWRIGVQHPRKMGRIVEVIGLKDKAVATSGDYYRFFFIKGERHSHIVNPGTGMTVQENPMSVSIIAPTCTDADALATGVFVLGPEKGIKLIESLKDVEGMIIGKEMKVIKSSGWSEFELTEKDR
ncbi:FAD:protein FMN transferase [Candidatus Aerophobetes bacterium]|nr:FAD:protein FMN transferase [Candidatus Aerophobetes bacterium]